MAVSFQIDHSRTLLAQALGVANGVAEARAPKKSDRKDANSGIVSEVLAWERQTRAPKRFPVKGVLFGIDTPPLMRVML